MLGEEVGVQGGYKLHWGHHVGTLLHWCLDDRPTTPPEGSSATPGAPGAVWINNKSGIYKNNTGSKQPILLGLVGNPVIPNP